mgnify:CR=1 FL=1
MLTYFGRRALFLDISLEFTTITCNSNLEVTLDASATSGNNTYNWTTLNGNITSQTGSTAVVEAAGDYVMITVDLEDLKAIAD